MSRFSPYRLLIFALCLAAPAAAASLDDYQKRVGAAKLDVIALRRLEDEGAAYSELRRQKLDEVRRALPAAEKIETQGSEIETGNKWLADSIGLYADERDARRRKEILVGIEQRLTAVAEQIEDLKKAEASDLTKDANKQKLAEILRRPEYQKPEAQQESLFQRWYRAVMEWLRKAFPEAPEAPPAPSGFGSLKFLLQVLIYALVAGLIGFLAYKFGPSVARRFGRRRKEKKTDRVILGERIGADETAENLFGEAERLAREGALREAIRKGYIAALCELSDRKIVRLARHKTNRDYLRDVRKTRAGLVENMAGLTGTYERNWYGLRVSEMADWEDFRAKYREVTRIDR